MNQFCTSCGTPVTGPFCTGCGASTGEQTPADVSPDPTGQVEPPHAPPAADADPWVDDGDTIEDFEDHTIALDWELSAAAGIESAAPAVDNEEPSGVTTVIAPIHDEPAWPPPTDPPAMSTQPIAHVPSFVTPGPAQPARAPEAPSAYAGGKVLAPAPVVPPVALPPVAQVPPAHSGAAPAQHHYPVPVTPRGGGGLRTALISFVVTVLLIAAAAGGYLAVRHLWLDRNAAEDTASAVPTADTVNTPDQPSTLESPEAAGQITPTHEATTVTIEAWDREPASAPAEVQIMTTADGRACESDVARDAFGGYPAAFCRTWQESVGLRSGARLSTGDLHVTCQADLGEPNPVFTENQANTWWFWTQADNGVWDWFPQTALSQGATMQPTNGIAICYR